MSSSSRGGSYLGNLFNQVASGVSTHISQSGLQNVAQNIGEAFRGPRQPSNASSTATTPDTEQQPNSKGPRGGDFSHPFSLFMGNGGLCGRGNRRTSTAATGGGVGDSASQQQNVEMRCDNCNIRFSIFTSRKRECPECRQCFCDGCFATTPTALGTRKVCERCKVLLRDPPVRADLMELRVIDLKRYLMSKKISVKNCVEKKDLVELVVRENGGGVEHHSGALGRPTSPPRPSGSRPVEKAQQSFPKSYVESTHRQEWFDSMERSENADEEQVEAVDEREDQGRTLVEDLQGGEPSEETPVVPMSDVSAETEQQPALSSSLPSNPEPIRPSLSDRLMMPEAQTTSSSMPSSPKRFANQGLVHLSDIESLEDLQELSVKQCKEILAINRVNFKGVVEKEELLKILARLWKQEQRLKEGKEEMEDDELCKICMDNAVDCVMLECGHMCTCTSCGKLMNECPICRQYVVRVVKIFKA